MGCGAFTEILSTRLRRRFSRQGGCHVKAASPLLIESARQKVLNCRLAQNNLPRQSSAEVRSDAFHTYTTGCHCSPSDWKPDVRKFSLELSLVDVHGCVPAMPQHELFCRRLGQCSTDSAVMALNQCHIGDFSKARR